MFAVIHCAKDVDGGGTNGEDVGYVNAPSVFVRMAHVAIDIWKDAMAAPWCCETSVTEPL